MTYEGAVEPMAMSEICAFTGHRPVKFDFGYNEADARCQAIIKQIGIEIEQLVKRGVKSFISGMALGVDTWAAEAVLAMKRTDPYIKLYCAVPCKGQESKWSAESQRRYRRILEQADRTIVLADRYTPGCMEARDRWMVDRAGVILAVLRKDLQQSGTGLTVSYARECGRDIIVIDPDALVIADSMTR